MNNIDNIKHGDTETIFRKATACFQKGDLPSCELLVKKILSNNSRHAGACHLMGLVKSHYGQYDMSIRMFGRAIDYNHHEPSYYHDLGNVFMTLGDYEKAISCYQKTVSIKPDYIDAKFKLANAYAALGRYKMALACYTSVIEENPDYAEAHYSIGFIQQTLGNLDLAIANYKRALSIKPDFIEAYNNLGTSNEAIGNHEEAISCYQSALSINPEHAKTHNNMGVVFQARGNNEKALECYKKATRLEPGYAIAHCNLGVVLNKLGRPDDAIDSFQKSLDANPSLVAARWGALLTLPLQYDSVEDINIARKNWEAGITELLNTIDLASSQGIAEAKRAASMFTSFHINYQGLNDLKLQIHYGELLTRIANAAYSEYTHLAKNNRPCTNRKIRVGFVSSCFYNHSVFKSHGHWITKLGITDFEVSVFYVGIKKDLATQAISARADHFLDIRDTDELIQAICRQKLDVLIYLDIGMEPRIQLPPALRLAPVQCTTWGHPVSSGLSTIDYYLSSELMEPADGDSHYVEKLVRLPNLGVSYPFPDTTIILIPDSMERDSKSIIFLNLQNLIKLLPQYDEIYPKIAKQVPGSKFWFLCGLNTLAEKFLHRLSRAFGKYELNAEDYIVMHPKLNQAEFFGLVKSADIILDSISWSGCNSTMEALAFDKPVVTMAGSMMRSRHSDAILRRINITDTIANNLDEYIKIATKLGLDISFREAVSKKISGNKYLAYNDQEVIDALENFLRSVVNFMRTET